MSEKLNIRMVQDNPAVGDMICNFQMALRALKKAEADGVDIVLFSEMFITGYPPKDRILESHFVKAAETMVLRLAELTKNMNVAFVMGLPLQRETGRHNSAMFIHKGKVLQEYHKQELPNYGVFDEKRVFDAGPAVAKVLIFKSTRIGVMICEDGWHDAVPQRWAKKRIDLMLWPNASPYFEGKPKLRLDVIGKAANNAGAPVAYCNPYGAQDELQFDGRSCVANPRPDGRYQIQGMCDAWRADEMDCTFTEGAFRRIRNKPYRKQIWHAEPDNYSGAVTGLRDYMRKTGQKKVILGSSGGIDSAEVAAMAVDALGADNVILVMLPSPYSSEGSLTDAIALAENLGVKHNYLLKIGDPYETMQKQLGIVMGDNWQLPFEKVGDENLQPRLRMNYINAIANELTDNGIPTMALTTGNKSELAMGYFTAGGDGFGFYNPLKDLYKLQVYGLARWRNTDEANRLFGTDGERIPENIIVKEPSAELKPGQQDSDSLPPYPVLDSVLELVMERGEDPIYVAKHPLMAYEGTAQEWYDTVKWIYGRLVLVEFKRRVGPLGPILSPYSFDLDRRYPIVDGYNPFDYADEGSITEALLQVA